MSDSAESVPTFASISFDFDASNRRRICTESPDRSPHVLGDTPAPAASPASPQSQAAKVDLPLHTAHADTAHTPPPAADYLGLNPHIPAHELDADACAVGDSGNVDTSQGAAGHNSARGPGSASGNGSGTASRREEHASAHLGHRRRLLPISHTLLGMDRTDAKKQKDGGRNMHGVGMSHGGQVAGLAQRSARQDTGSAMSDLKRVFSINPFKRRPRFNQTAAANATTTTVAQKKDDEKKPSSLSRPEWLRKLPSSSFRSSSPPSPPPPPPQTSSLADMPVPPTFVPPGLQRVPTPTNDAAVQIKGKLADFFFDMHGNLQSKPYGHSVSRRRPKFNMSSTPGGIWDSDAILMSMSHGLDLSSSSDETSNNNNNINNDNNTNTTNPESHSKPRKPKKSPLRSSAPRFHLGPVIDSTPNLMATPCGTTRPKSDTETSGETSEEQVPIVRRGRIRNSSSDDAEATLKTAQMLTETDERCKFEWLVPEHLPDSPTCPLHGIYRGPSKGVCYWHGRGSRGFTGGGSEKAKRSWGMKGSRGTGAGANGCGEWDGSGGDMVGVLRRFVGFSTA